MKIITISYNDFTNKYIVDYSPSLGKKRKAFRNLESLLKNLGEDIKRPKRKMVFLLRGDMFPEGNDKIKQRISKLFPKAVYEIHSLPQ